tara:strand:+ start:47 stop:628 length:582 start_codon:yes stop_codon:yes gene_type:complete
MNFNIQDLDTSIFLNVVVGMQRDWDEYIYFDKLTGNVLHHVEGYFVIMNKNLDGSQNKILKERILQFDETDSIDESRHILIDKMGLVTFLCEWADIASKEYKPFADLVEDYQQYFNKRNYRKLHKWHYTVSTFREFVKFYLNRFGADPDLKRTFIRITDICNICLGRKWIWDQIDGGDYTIFFGQDGYPLLDF